MPKHVYPFDNGCQIARCAHFYWQLAAMLPPCTSILVLPLSARREPLFLVDIAIQQGGTAFDLRCNIV
jgi:hypothetical protein